MCILTFLTAWVKLLICSPFALATDSWRAGKHNHTWRHMTKKQKKTSCCWHRENILYTNDHLISVTHYNDTIRSYILSFPSVICSTFSIPGVLVCCPLLKWRKKTKTMSQSPHGVLQLCRNHNREQRAEQSWLLFHRASRNQLQSPRRPDVTWETVIIAEGSISETNK